MPELPEVEVTRLGVHPHVHQQIVEAVVFRRDGLRWPFPHNLAEFIQGRPVLSTSRRGKYLLLHFSTGSVLIHLGMSGHLRIVPRDTAATKHEHFDLVFSSQVLRLSDPRRFGAVLWHAGADWQQHPLLQKLGVEPLQAGFDGELLYRLSRGRSSSIKQFILQGEAVVGVGNIYVSESLFKAGIKPQTAAGKVSLARYQKLALAIQETLSAAIAKGGSSLKDFVGVNGQSGYFQQNYYVYDRAGLPCRICGIPVKQIVQGQRSTFYCQKCQK